MIIVITLCIVIIGILSPRGCVIFCCFSSLCLFLLINLREWVRLTWVIKSLTVWINSLSVQIHTWLLHSYNSRLLSLMAINNMFTIHLYDYKLIVLFLFHLLPMAVCSKTQYNILPMKRITHVTQSLFHTNIIQFALKPKTT